MSIIAKNITKEFGTPPVKVLQDIDLEIQDGEFVALTGKSGSGKSTLLYIISSLDYPSSGTVIINDREVSAMGEDEIHQFRNRHVGFVFQFHHLLPELTTFDNVILPARKTGQHRNKERIEYVMSVLEKFGIADRAKRLPSQLSGGERQRVALARALSMEPDHIFADEPTGNLDSKNGQIVMDLFKRINKEKKTTIIMVTHDLDFASIARRQIVLVDGRISKNSHNYNPLSFSH